MNSLSTTGIVLILLGLWCRKYAPSLHHQKLPMSDALEIQDLYILSINSLHISKAVFKNLCKFILFFPFQYGAVDVIYTFIVSP